jgi:hypothetical protein
MVAPLGKLTPDPNPALARHLFWARALTCEAGDLGGWKTLAMVTHYAHINAWKAP